MSRWPCTVLTVTWKDWPLASSFLSKQFGLRPVLWIDWHHQITEAVWEEQLPVLQLLFIAIALAAADLVHAEALLVVVNRFVTTAQVAAIVAEWEGRRVLLNNTFRFQHRTLVIMGHVPITITALHLRRGEN